MIKIVNCELCNLTVPIFVFSKLRNKSEKICFGKFHDKNFKKFCKKAFRGIHFNKKKILNFKNFVAY
jgi:hypothetical protein